MGDKRQPVDELENASTRSSPQGADAVPPLLRELARTPEVVPQGKIAPPTFLGPYRIEAKVGEGGMGAVYRAVDTRLNRPVAIKFLAGELADESARRRFQQEAKTASSLNHPHILTVHEAGEFEGRQYLVTEFVDGGTLPDWARKTKPSWRQVTELLVGVADGLACAHAAGILHRDIKPANILVAKNGYAKLADFGLAKLTEPQEEPSPSRAPTMVPTKPGMIVGTIAYMSPEQASGRSVDARSDIFSFGVVLYELLAARRPFAGTTDLEVLQELIHSPAEPLTPDLPYALRMAVEKSLEKDPSERYQSMRDFVVDLRRVARKKAAGRAPAPVAVRSGWKLWAAGAALGLASGAAGWGLTRMSPSMENPLANAKFTRLTDFEGAEMDAAISPDGKFVAFLSDRDGPLDIFLSQVGTGHFLNFTQENEKNLRTVGLTTLRDGFARPLGPSPRTVGFSGDGSEIWLTGNDPKTSIRLMPLMGGEPRTFLRGANPAWSPDGARLVYHTGDPGDPMFVADRTGGNARRIFIDRPGVHNHFPAWSHDGRWIYFARGAAAAQEMDIWRISPSGGEPERMTRHNSNVAYPTPIDPQTVLYVARDRDGSGPWLWTLDVKRKVSRRVSFGLEQYTSVAASADGRRLVATVANPTASLWSAPVLDRPAEEADVKPFALPTVRALAPRFGPTSLFYLSSRGTGDGLWRYQDGQALEIWRGDDGYLLEPVGVSPDGRRVTIVLRRDGKLRLYLLSAEGTELEAIGETVDVRGANCWSPAMKWIVTGGNDGKGEGLFKIPVDMGEPVRLMEGAALNPVWSPDGSLIVYAGAAVGGVAPLLAVTPDGVPVDLPAIKVPSRVVSARFLADGKSLVYAQGFAPLQDFWLLDLTTKKSRPLTHLRNRALIRTFDITPDAKQIVFDRQRENSDIVLIDLPRLD